MRTISLLVYSRRTAILAAMAAMIAANGPSRRRPRVLFVCEHGTVKSPIARELLRTRATARGIPVKVRSRGIAPKEAATPELAAALVRDGIDVKREPLRRLSRADAKWADVVVHFHPLPLDLPASATRDWTDTPSVNGEYAAAMARIGERIDALLGDLARGAIGRSTRS